MYIMQKSVSWSSIVKLGCDLSDHCRQGSELREVCMSEGWCPQNCASFGERGASLGDEWAKEEKCDLLEKRKSENYFLDHDGIEQEDDQFLRSLSVRRDQIDRLWWISATSGTTIDCLKKDGKWTAEIREGHKPSRYGKMWAEMTA